MAYIKGYMARVKKHLEENNAARVAPFMAAAQNFIKKVIAKFDDYSLYGSVFVGLCFRRLV